MPFQWFQSFQQFQSLLKPLNAKIFSEMLAGGWVKTIGTFGTIETTGTVLTRAARYTFFF